MATQKYPDTIVVLVGLSHVCERLRTDGDPRGQRPAVLVEPGVTMGYRADVAANLLTRRVAAPYDDYQRWLAAKAIDPHADDNGYWHWADGGSR